MDLAWVRQSLDTADTPLSIVQTENVATQYLSGFLIGLGNGGVVGASTLGVALFSIYAPDGALKEMTAIVPVVNCVSNLVTVAVYVKHAKWGLCMRMWPLILVGIVIGNILLPFIPETQLRALTSFVYGALLLQRLSEKLRDWRSSKGKDADDKGHAASEERKAFYNSLPVMAAFSIICGVVTVITNNSGPIFNIYLLATGLNMDEFVASRAVMMAGKNVAKVVMSFLWGRLSWNVFLHGVQVGTLALIGLQVAKPIKRNTATWFYEYATYVILIYVCVKMWR